MKKILAFVMCFVVMLVCFCGCDAKNNDVSSESDSAESSETNSTTQVNNGYFHTYEGEPLAHKKYTIYSSPRSGVKEGIANDPATEIIAVKDATKLYFGFVSGCDIEDKPFTSIERTKYTDDSLPYHKVVEFLGKKYEIMSNFHNNTNVVTEAYTLAGEEFKFTKQCDIYSVFSENSADYVGSVTVRRDTGKVVEYEAWKHDSYSNDDATPLTDEEARAKIVQYVKDLCGEDVAEDFNLESAELEKIGKRYRIYSSCYIGGYRICYAISVTIADDGKLLNINIYEYYHSNEALKKAFEKYGKEAFDKAKAILESAVELPDSAMYYIAFDSDGKLFLVVTTNRDYPQTPPICEGIHPMHYAVEILPIE